jgi:hypothetical protein
VLLKCNESKWYCFWPTDAISYMNLNLWQTPHQLILNFPSGPISACLTATGSPACDGTEVDDPALIGRTGGFDQAVDVEPAGESAISLISRFDIDSTMLLARDCTRTVAGPLKVTKSYARQCHVLDLNLMNVPHLPILTFLSKFVMCRVQKRSIAKQQSSSSQGRIAYQGSRKIWKGVESG